MMKVKIRMVIAVKRMVVVKEVAVAVVVVVATMIWVHGIAHLSLENWSVFTISGCCWR